MSQASIFEPILAALPGITDDKGNVLSNPFLSTCGYVIPVIDQLGTALYPVKSDIGGNIDRLRKRYETDTARFHVIFAIVEDEIKAGTASGSSSCSNGLLWLKRANQFIVAFLVQLRANPSQSLKDAAYAAYEATLSKYHNWLTRKAFEAALAFVPTREAFMAKLGTDQERVGRDMDTCASQFTAILNIIDKWMEEHGVNALS
eukprot:jgi/Mesvir1/3744/Mv15020-RA.1